MLSNVFAEIVNPTRTPPYTKWPLLTFGRTQYRLWVNYPASTSILRKSLSGNFRWYFVASTCAGPFQMTHLGQLAG